MKYMADEMLEELPQVLANVGIECKIVFEWIDGAKQKTRKINDSEIRKFLQQKQDEGEPVTLVTNDRDSYEQITADGLPVIYILNFIRDYLLNSKSI